MNSWRGGPSNFASRTSRAWSFSPSRGAKCSRRHLLAHGLSPRACFLRTVMSLLGTLRHFAALQRGVRSRGQTVRGGHAVFTAARDPFETLGQGSSSAAEDTRSRHAKVRWSGCDLFRPVRTRDRSCMLRQSQHLRYVCRWLVESMRSVQPAAGHDKICGHVLA